jgi:hypothetical protein
MTTPQYFIVTNEQETGPLQVRPPLHWQQAMAHNVSSNFPLAIELCGN